MVPKQCPFRRPTIWYLVCCATCLGSRDNSKYHTYIHTYIHTYVHDPSRISIDCLTPASRLRPSASVWIKHTTPTPWNQTSFAYPDFVNFNFLKSIHGLEVNWSFEITLWVFTVDACRCEVHIHNRSMLLAPIVALNCLTWLVISSVRLNCLYVHQDIALRSPKSV